MSTHKVYKEYTKCTKSTHKVYKEYTLIVPLSITQVTRYKKKAAVFSLFKIQYQTAKFINRLFLEDPWINIFN